LPPPTKHWPGWPPAGVGVCAYIWIVIVPDGTPKQVPVDVLVLKDDPGSE
jgi:hypothetical protein